MKAFLAWPNFVEKEGHKVDLDDPSGVKNFFSCSTSRQAAKYRK